MQIKRNVNLLAWLSFFVDFKLYAPLAIIYFTSISHSFALGMSVFSVIMLSAAIFELPTGIFSDRIGRKKTVFLGAITATLAVTLYAVGSYYWVLLLGAVFEGLSRSFYSGNNDAMLHDSLTEVDLSHLYHHHAGKIIATSQAALAISAVLGGLIGSVSFSAILWISAVFQAVTIPISFMLIEPTIIEKQKTNLLRHLSVATKNFIHNKKLRYLSLASILGFGIGEAMYQFQAAFFQQLWPIWAIGLAKMASNIGAGTSSYFGGKIVDRFGAARVLLGHTIFSRVANFVGAIFPTIFSPVLMTATSFTVGGSWVAASKLAQEEFSSEQRATMGSLSSFAGSLFFAVCSYTIGLFADTVGPAQTIAIAQVAMLPTIFFYWKLYRHS